MLRNQNIYGPLILGLIIANSMLSITAPIEINITHIIFDNKGLLLECFNIFKYRENDNVVMHFQVDFCIYLKRR